jgi:hypothetical protein
MFQVSDNLRMLESLAPAFYDHDLDGFMEAVGDGPGRIYVVAPTGAIEDDPNLTDKR